MLVDGERCRIFTDGAVWEASLDGSSFKPAWSAGRYGCEPWKRFDITGYARNDGRMMRQPSTVMSFSAGRIKPKERIWLVFDGVERGGLEYGGKIALKINGERTETLAGGMCRVEITRFVRSGENELCILAAKARNARIVTTPPDEGPYDLRCEYLREPLGVVKPRFFWKYTGAKPENWVLTVHGCGSAETAEHLYVEPKLKLEPWRRYRWSVSGLQGDGAEMAV